jgi:hypothetical protein
MNIDISNAHCGFRALSVTHAWPRVARSSNPRRRPRGRRRALAHSRPAPGPCAFLRGGSRVSDGRWRCAKSLRFERALARPPSASPLAASPTGPAGLALRVGTRTVLSSLSSSLPRTRSVGPRPAPRGGCACPGGRGTGARRRVVGGTQPPGEPGTGFRTLSASLPHGGCRSRRR